MRFPVNTTLMLAVFVLSLGIVHLVHPLPGLYRISPLAFFIVGAVLGLRYAAHRQAGKREELLKAVPRRPLGLDE